MSVSPPLELNLLSDPANLATVRAAVRQVSVEAGFADADAEQIALAVDEALANVIKHGYGMQTNRPIRLRAEVVSEERRTGLRFVVRDYGRVVDPATICGRDLEEVRPGGLGVHIIRSVMDEVCYEPAVGGGTCLSMLKWKRHD